MHVILDEQEAWSFMSLVTSLVIDQVELSDDGVEAVREWRTKLSEGSPEMSVFVEGLNEALGSKIDDELRKQIRRRDYYRT
jgi:hypothetical protein